MLKIVPPAFGKSLDLNCATKQSDVVLLACIQSGDIAHPYTAFASFDQFNLITNSDFALLQHGKIEARTLTRQEPLDDVRAAELDPELCNRASAARSPSRRPSQREIYPQYLVQI